MDENSLKDLHQLVDFLKTNGIAEFEVERPDLKLRLKFQGEPDQQGIDMAQLSRLMAQAPPASQPVQHASAHSAPPAAAAEPAPAAAVEEVLHVVKSPIVGTFYDSPSPGSPAFVTIGDVVEVGQILCIVEAMKLMNEIECDTAGEVVKRIAITGQPVEYGQPLFSIKPS